MQIVRFLPPGLFRLVFALLYSVCAIPIAASSSGREPVHSPRKTLDFWSTYRIPGTFCGNGSDYYFYLRPGRRDKMAIEFRGGGACWNRRTCFGPLPLTDLNRADPDDRDGFSSAALSDSPLADATYVSLPYCTGDVHAGRHIAEYDGKRVLHFGAENIDRVFEFLDQELELFHSARSFYLLGQSAGALGALLHLRHVDGYLDPAAMRTALIDSPGLHFGRSFWAKFPQRWTNDLMAAMHDIGLYPEVQDGNIARYLPGLCERFGDWKIGFLQSTKDLMMSLVFGNITQWQHRRMMLSPEGLSALAKQHFGQCAVWLHPSGIHTFLGESKKFGKETNGVSALEFAEALIRGEPLPSVIPERAESSPDEW